MTGKAKRKQPGNRQAPQQERIEAQRRRLTAADAMLMCVRYARDSQTGGLDELPAMDAPQVASSIINEAVAALELPRKSPRGA